MTRDLRGRALAGTKLVALGDVGVQVETIHRFKGFETEAIVILPERLTARSCPRVRRHDRARSHLIVIGTYEAREKIGWSRAAVL